MRNGIIVASALLILVIVALAAVLVAAVILRGRNRRERAARRGAGPDAAMNTPIPDAWAEAGRRAVPEPDGGAGTNDRGAS